LSKPLARECGPDRIDTATTPHDRESLFSTVFTEGHSSVSLVLAVESVGAARCIDAVALTALLLMAWNLVAWAMSRGESVSGSSGAVDKT
jgi:hypothetical protein